MNRYANIILKARKGTEFHLSNGANGDLIIESKPAYAENEGFKSLPFISAGEYARVPSIYEDPDGNLAIIPPGWAVSKLGFENTINDGLVIYNSYRTNNVNWNEVTEVQKMYDQMVWIPVSMLDANKTLNGTDFNQKFGRKNFYSENNFMELLEENEELCKTVDSVNYFEGMYITRYPISIDPISNMPRSKMNRTPLTNCTFDEMHKIASKFECKNKFVSSHLTFGSEIDTIISWISKSDANSIFAEELLNSDIAKRCSLLTGVGYSVKNICDFSSGLSMCTQEEYGDDKSFYISRGGLSDDESKVSTIATRKIVKKSDRSPDIGFRAVVRFNPF